MEVDVNNKEENDNDDDNALLVVKDLSRALLQISKCVESRYLGPPLGKKFNLFTLCVSIRIHTRH